MRRLTEANLHIDVEALHESLALLVEIESAWSAIQPATGRVAAGATA